MPDSHAPEAFEPLGLSTFEKLYGEHPSQVLDRHADGRHVALQVIASLKTTVQRAAVWDLETRRIAWAPNGASVMAWLPGGERIALVNEERASAYAFVFASWPGRAPLDRCALHFPTGWPEDLVLSPRGDLAVVQWMDQEESGLEFVALGPDGPRQLAETGLSQVGPLRGIPNGGGFALNTSLVFRPVFSSDGRYLLVLWQDEWVWWSEGAYDFDAEGNYVAPVSPGGDYTLGMISVLDWQERTHHAIPLVARVALGWRPEPRDDGAEGLLVEPPTFLDAEHFTVALPTGSVRTFSVAGAMS